MAKDVRPKWIAFGKYLRNLRVEQGLSRRDVGLRLNVGAAMVGSFERATRVPKRDQVDKLEALFATDGKILEFWKDTQLEGQIPERLRSALALERRATQIWEYQSIIVPGLLQTSNYARALVQARAPEATEEAVDKIVNSRVQRLEGLQERRVKMWFVLDEIVLELPIGSPSVLIEQLDWIAELVDTGMIRVQSLPLLGAPGLCAPFRLASLGGTNLALYLEHAMGGEIVETQATVAEAQNLFNTMQGEALSTRATLDRITQIKERHSAQPKQSNLINIKDTKK